MKRMGVFDMKRILSLVIVCLMMCAQPALAGAYPIATINNPKAPHTVQLREGKGTSTKSLGEYYSGTTVVVYDGSGEWWQVEIFGRKGYMQASFLIPSGEQGSYDDAAIASAYQAKPQAVVNNPDPADRLNLRDRPSKDASSSVKFYNNTPVEILGRVGDYSLVIVGGDSWGYMQTKYLKEGEVSMPALAEAGTPSGYAVVNNPKVEDKLYLRAEAKDGSERLGEYLNGTTVELLAKDGAYQQVRIYDRIGYMHTDYLRPDSDTPDKVAITQAEVRLDATGSRVPLFSYPATNSPTVVSAIPEGTRVAVVGRAGVWYQVSYDGHEGYVQAQWVLPGGDFTGQYGVVANPDARDRLHLRAKAEAGSQSLGQYFNGTQVEILGGGDSVTLRNWQSAAGWYHVRVGNQEGYMMIKFVCPVSVGDPSTW